MAAKASVGGEEDEDAADDIRRGNPRRAVERKIRKRAKFVARLTQAQDRALKAKGSAIGKVSMAAHALPPHALRRFLGQRFSTTIVVNSLKRGYKYVVPIPEPRALPCTQVLEMVHTFPRMRTSTPLSTI